MGAPKCGMSVLRNVGIVERLCHSLSCYQIELMKELCPMSLYFTMLILQVIKHIETEKCPCCPINFRGRGP